MGIMFHSSPNLISLPLPTSSLSLSHLPAELFPTSVKEKALSTEIQALQVKGAVEQAPPTPGLYSWVFVAMKASGVLRLIIDLSILNLEVAFTKFYMETPQSVLRSVRKRDWMVLVDLQDAYLQVPVHPESRHFLKFVSPAGTFQFSVLPLGLTTVPKCLHGTWLRSR